MTGTVIGRSDQRRVGIVTVTPGGRVLAMGRTVTARSVGTTHGKAVTGRNNTNTAAAAGSTVTGHRNLSIGRS